MQANKQNKLNLRIATKSQTIYEILGYLPKTLQIELQILCKRFYNKIIPQLLYNYDTQGTAKMLDEMMISRFYSIKQGHYLWSSTMNEALTPKWELAKWNSVQIQDLKLLFGTKIEKVVALLDQYYLVDVQNTVLKIHTMSYKGNIKTVNQVDINRIYQTHYCTGASNLIIRVGGYWIEEKKNGRTEVDKIKYNDRISIFNAFTNQWDITSFGNLNQSRHNCGACTVGNEYLYIFGGSFYRQYKNNNIFSANSIERQNLMNPTDKAEILLINATLPHSYIPFAMHYQEDKFLLFGKVYDEKNPTSHQTDLFIVDLSKKNIWNKQYLTKEEFCPIKAFFTGEKVNKDPTFDKLNRESQSDADIQQIIRAKNKILLVNNYGIIWIKDENSYKTFNGPEKCLKPVHLHKPSSRPMTAITKQSFNKQ